MFILSNNIIIELTGRLHPLMVHFPIGLLVGAWLLAIIAKFQKKENGLKSVIYLGALAALLSAIMGQFLYQNESYAGDIIERHQLLGWITAGLALVTAFCYLKATKLPSWLPLTVLSISVLSISITGHYGASLTHGSDYLTGVFDKKNNTNTALLMAKWTEIDTFNKTQLDKLNLEVRAIFAHNCYKCHSTAKQKGGLALDHKEGVFAGGDSGTILVKGNAAKSEIIRRLKLPRNDEDAMPSKGKILPKESIQLIELWINQGALWAAADLKIFREAPLALEMPQIPPKTDGYTHPIDRFVYQYFKEKGIQWEKTINDQRFIRRAYLDITGLLPKPEQITQFVQNPSDNKREALIQTLLEDTENYALHWLSFWNDLLRNDYSGPGFITKGRKQITNWLYKSLLDNKRYNQLVAELINPTAESEGFIKGIQWRGVVNASQRTELQAAQNISQSLLGLNLKCASCHNSFVNNLTLEQAYGFANIFTNSPLEIYRCDKPTGQLAKTSFIYEELGEVMADSLVDRLRQLADVITQPKNGRLYRTIVNRFWAKLFGRGIVAPVDEMDKLPWNTELLDWLAADFRENGYDLKHLLKTIMTSKAYQLSAVDYPSPNYLASENFVFRGPSPRRLTAEQTADAISQSIHPLYHGAAYLPSNLDFPAQWIWFQDIELDRKSLPKPGRRYFRKNFQSDYKKKVTAAEILITADHTYELFFNEVKIGQGNDWRTVQRFELSPKVILSENIIAAIGTNEGSLPNPAGLLFALKLTYKDNTVQTIYSDRTWITTDASPSKNWMSLNFSPNDWEKVSSRGNQGDWGQLPNFTFNRKETPSPFVRASLVKLDPFMKTLGRPTRENVATTREGNPTLLQALLVTNSDFLHQNIQEGTAEWLKKAGDNHQQLIEVIYWNTLGRKPSKKEKQLILKQLENQPIESVIEDVIWSIILLPEFQFL